MPPSILNQGLDGYHKFALTFYPVVVGSVELVILVSSDNDKTQPKGVHLERGGLFSRMEPCSYHGGRKNSN